jgi:hypothetical protein
MRNDEVRRTRKLLPHDPLNRLVRLVIQTRRCLVQNENLAVPYERPREGDELSLTLRVVGPAARNG